MQGISRSLYHPGVAENVGSGSSEHPPAGASAGTDTAGNAEAAAATTAATSEALAIVARAEQSAAEIVAEAREFAATTRAEAEARARGLLEDARATADGVRSEGLELVAKFREMSNSMHANAERLLGDVQRVHSSLVAQIARVEHAAGVGSGSGSPGRRSGAGEPTAGDGRSESAADYGRSESPAGDDLDVPEFIPPG